MNKDDGNTVEATRVEQQLLKDFVDSMKPDDMKNVEE